ncbi:MAG: septum formation inhibitor Maf [Clostridia bacterium]|nr:septum formation inhibitor Maf [Clostridia bacterium]
MRIVLASKSPRRIELLRSLGLDIEICPADVDENIDEVTEKPQEAVTLLASRKAQAIVQKLCDPAALIIAADTLVYKDKTLLGKPRDEDEAFSMLRTLSGDRHSVYTGICVAYGGKIAKKAVETAVFFRNLSDDEIENYVKSGEPMDKAGAYGIQGRACLFVKGIEGDYFNVVGLPLTELFEMIKENFGISHHQMI